MFAQHTVEFACHKLNNIKMQDFAIVRCATYHEQLKVARVVWVFGIVLELMVLTFRFS